jgi:hypothetical protein
MVILWVQLPLSEIQENYQIRFYRAKVFYGLYMYKKVQPKIPLKYFFVYALNCKIFIFIFLYSNNYNKNS